MQFIEHLTKKIRDAVVFNSDIQVAPTCILWPDHDRQWEKVIKSLLNELPELLILGDYNPEMRTGPAIWLRCVIAGKNNDLEIPNDRVPIIYLPGVSRQDLRVVKNYPDYLKPMAELQYRGVIWSQVNAKDWTILAYLKSDQGGLGLDVSQDKETKKAMQRALNRLLYEDVERLKDKRLDKNDFNALLTSDPKRDLLQWLNQGDEFQNGHDEDEWKAFVEVCNSQLTFDPQNDGLLTGVSKLASHEGPWKAVWERFCEAPKRYPNIPVHIRKCKHPTSLSWYNPGLNDYDGWPQWNEEQENNLREKLETLDSVPPHERREIIAKLENEHGSRRNLVWAELGEASLAQALEHLSVLAQNTANALAAGTIDDLVAGYQNTGWQADDAVIRTLACVEKQEDFEVVKTVIRLIYEPWAEESARYLQKIVDESGYPGGTASTHKVPNYNDGECIFFVDGLRFDTAKRLVKMLKDSGSHIEETLAWAALPSVTATGKPAVTPVRDKIYGNEASIDFEPSISESGQSLKGGYHLKKLLKEGGWEIEPLSKIIVNGNAWYEFGNIDHEGHERRWKLAKYLDGILEDIRDRVTQLLAMGWNRIHIVTDHGWLLLPGGLPKSELPAVQTETRWGRCAVIKSGASTNERLYPWYWNPEQHFALANGISCFRNGVEYTHGGVSLQECLTLELIVSSVAPHTSNITTEITDVVWKRLRCTVVVDGEFNGLSLDIRTQPGNSASSVVMSVKPLKDDGKVSVVVEDDDLEGTKATIVLIDTKGNLISQIETIIGGGIE
jgi:hypothetical protein